MAQLSQCIGRRVQLVPWHRQGRLQGLTLSSGLDRIQSLQVALPHFWRTDTIHLPWSSVVCFGSGIQCDRVEPCTPGVIPQGYVYQGLRPRYDLVDVHFDPNDGRVLGLMLSRGFFQDLFSGQTCVPPHHLHQAADGTFHVVKGGTDLVLSQLP